MKHGAHAQGFSWLHFEALRYVRDHGRPTMRDIAAHFSITPPAATLLVEGLVANRMLRRIVEAKDRRTVRVALTAKGKTYLDAGVRYRTKKIKEMFSVLNEKEYEELVRILQKINDS